MTAQDPLFPRLGNDHHSTHTMSMHLDDTGLSIAGIAIEAGYCEAHAILELSVVIATNAMGGSDGDDIHQ